MDSQRRSSFGGRPSSASAAKITLYTDRTHHVSRLSCRAWLWCRSGPIPVSSDKDFCPLVGLSPFQPPSTIRVKVGKIYELRKFTPKREPHEESAVFTALLIDNQATQIEGTFWRESAEYYHERLVEGKVCHTFSHFDFWNAIELRSTTLATFPSGKPTNVTLLSILNTVCISTHGRHGTTKCDLKV